jgi:hypothetical protein
MTIPKILMEAAEKWLEQYWNSTKVWIPPDQLYSRMRRDTMAAYEACFNHLCELSAREFDETSIAEYAGYHNVDIKELHRTESPALFEYAKRIARHQHTLDTAALLEANSRIKELEAALRKAIRWVESDPMDKTDSMWNDLNDARKALKGGGEG